MRAKERVEMMSKRKEHIEWCKKRALERVEKGELAEAVVALSNDMSKSSKTIDHPLIDYGMILVIAGYFSTAKQVKEFINTIN